MFRTQFLALAAGAVLGHAVAAQTIKIGVSGPYSGVSESVGVAMRDGARVAAAEINNAGGIMGRGVALVERDDEGAPGVGERVAQSLINDEHVVATIGFVNTDVALATQRYYQKAEVPVLNAAATGSEIARQFIDRKSTRLNS